MAINQAELTARGMGLIKFSEKNGKIVWKDPLSGELYIDKDNELKKVYPKLKEEKLTPDQIKYGAMYLAASNLGFEMDLSHIKSPKDIAKEWHRIWSMHGEEGVDIDDERESYERDLKAGKKGSNYEVEIIKKELPFLFEVKKVKTNKMKSMKEMMNEDVQGVKSSGIPAIDTVGQDDGQPRRNFYVPSVMADRDVIANILEKFTKAGVTYSFSGDDLIITAGTYSTFAQDQVAQELQITIAEVLKFLKDEYKNEVGKVLKIGKEETSTYDVVANYTTNKLSLCRLTCVYCLPDSKAEEDAGLDKGDIRGNIPVMRPLVK